MRSLKATYFQYEKIRLQHSEVVLWAFRWLDSNPAHDFYEVDYLPENDNIHFTISPEAYKEVLKRLLEINHKLHAKEVKTGLWNKKPASKSKTLSSVRMGQGAVASKNMQSLLSPGGGEVGSKDKSTGGFPHEVEGQEFLFSQ